MTIEAGLSAIEAEQQLAALDDEVEVIEDGAEVADESDDYQEIDAEADDIQADADDAGEPEEAIEGEDEEEAEIEPETAIDAPSFMDATQRAQFASLPTDAQQIVVQQSQLIQADYTRKTQEIATKNKSLDTRLQQLDGMQTAAEQRLSEWDKVDWTQLAQNVSAEQYNAFRAQAEQERNEFDNLQNVRATQREAIVKSHVQEQMQQLPQVLPEAMDPKKGPALVQEIQTALMEAGTTPDNLQMVTAGQMKLVSDALKWRKAQINKATLRPKPGAKTKAKQIPAKSRASSSQKTGKRMQAFKRNPSARNAEALMLDID